MRQGCVAWECGLPMVKGRGHCPGAVAGGEQLRSPDDGVNIQLSARSAALTHARRRLCLPLWPGQDLPPGLATGTFPALC